MKQYRPLVRDQNSITGILEVLQQQIEKRKTFGQSNAKDFKFVIGVKSIQLHFEQYQH